jgi:hypothetical protein
MQQHADSATTANETLVNWISRPLTLSAVLTERMLALEAGRHPTLGELGAALGDDLRLDRVTSCAVREDDDDATLARAVDALYRDIGSTRAVRVYVSTEGPRPTRDDAPIAMMAEGEHLLLFILAENATDAGVAFSAEAHGEGIGGYIEPLRSGSALFDAGPMPRGRYLLPVMFVADGRAATIDLPIECD